MEQLGRLPPSLLHLNARDNRLASLEAVAHLTQLVELDMGDNKLESVRASRPVEFAWTSCVIRVEDAVTTSEGI